MKELAAIVVTCLLFFYMERKLKHWPGGIITKIITGILMYIFIVWFVVDVILK